MEKVIRKPIWILFCLCLLMGQSGNAAVLYNNDFENPSNISPSIAWPDLVDMSTGQPVRAQNGRLEWKQTSNHWLRLNIQLPTAYIVEFDFFFEKGKKDRFSFWPLVDDTASNEKSGNGIFVRQHYFLRDNTHYFDSSDAIPSEGPRNLSLPLGTPPHRIRCEVDGDHVALMYKVQGMGGWILIDERNFPAFPTASPRYIQFGMHGSNPVGLTYVDNLWVKGLSENRALITRDIVDDSYAPLTDLQAKLNVVVKGQISMLDIIEDIPKYWKVSQISHQGIAEGNIIRWKLENISQNVDLSYTATPPRLNTERLAYFSGSFTSGDDTERIGGDTAISIVLPYLYREAIDYDFSGSPVNGKKYPIGHDYGVRYAQGMDGTPTDVAYARPTGDNTIPAIGTLFTFPANADFHQGTITGRHTEGGYYLDGYRDDGESALEKGASDTGGSIGSINAGDWFRYTFDFGPTPQVILVNFSVNTWQRTPESHVDVYVDNKFIGEISAPNTSGNEFNFFQVGPTEIPGGEHSIVFAFPAGRGTPTDLGRIEVVKVSGIGEVNRKLTADGFFEPASPIQVSLNATALYGSYKAYIEERLPVGAEIVQVGNGGKQVGNLLSWELEPTTTSKTVTYTLKAPEGLRYLLFEGFADIGLPLADRVHGDSSVMNQAWLFGETEMNVKKDDFAGSALASPWFIEYGNDPSLTTDYKMGINIEITGGQLNLTVDPVGTPGKFDEWANGRRAPMILRADIPNGDWRFETEIALSFILLQNEFHSGIVVGYNDGADTDISLDEYLFGFYQGEIRVELTNLGMMGNLEYHNFTDEIEWLDFIDAGHGKATFAVTKRGDILIFSCKLPNRPWQLVGEPVQEPRTPTRIGLFTKVWGSSNIATTAFDNFKMAQLDIFTRILSWELY